MGTVENKDGDQLKLGPWPKGMNNRASEFEIEDGEVRYAVNVDFTNSGRIRRRLGYTPILEAARCRSVFAYDSTFLFVMGVDLYRGLPPNHSVFRAGVGAVDMSYVEVNSEIYYSNGSITGKIDTDGVSRPWGIPAPNPVPVVTATAIGSMHAGGYTVSVSYVDDRGEESGVAVCPAVTVPQGGGVQLSNIATSPDPTVTGVNIYMTKNNGDEGYLIRTLPNGTASYFIAAPVAQLRAIQTDVMDPFPACTNLRHFNGRIYGVDGNVIWYTDALRYGLTRMRSNFLLFADEVDMFEPSVDGLYVAHGGKTWWIEGKNPDDFKSAAVVLPCGAVRGTGVAVENSRDMAWFSPRGWIVGKPGGKVEQITEARVVVPSYTRGASLFREQRGIRQLINTVAGKTDSNFVSSDFADAETVRSVT